MQKREFGILLLVTCLILITTPPALGTTETVNPPSGTNDQNAINAAINTVSSGATPSNPGYVILTAGTYQVSAPIVLKSNVVLHGAGDSTIIYGNGESVCNTSGQPAYIYGDGVSYVEIYGLQFQSTASSFLQGGKNDYRNCIKLKNSNNCNVHDILFTPYLYCDGVRVYNSSYINVSKCRICAGHDGVSFGGSSHNCRMHDCDIIVGVNTGCRNDGTSNCEVDHNNVTGAWTRTGWCCLEVEYACTNLNIHHNILHDFTGSSKTWGIGNWYASGSIDAHDNVMWNILNHSTANYSGITLGTGNKLDPIENQTVEYWEDRGYGVQS